MLPPYTPLFLIKSQNLYQQPVTIGHPVMQQKDGARNEPFLDAFYYFFRSGLLSVQCADVPADGKVIPACALLGLG